MATASLDKKSILSQYRVHESDTASPQVQIALLSEKLKLLNDHFLTHVKDHSSRRGLMKMVGQRKRLLNYLQKRDKAAYNKLVTDLGIRVSKTSN